MKIQVLVDNKNSWIIPYANQLCVELAERKYNCDLIFDHEQIQAGNVLFLLSCEKILKKQQLELNQNNIVIHASNLPQGRGWSPLTWQILEGNNEIMITLLEATDRVDSGNIYLQSLMKLEGHELIDEIRDIMGAEIIKLALKFVVSFKEIRPRSQIGESTYYLKRTNKDSMLDVNKSIAEQFNLLRVCDNERYPAYFIYKGYKYSVKIEKKEKVD
jgi:methionyl-tRNA formyltransferase